MLSVLASRKEADYAARIDSFSFPDIPDVCNDANLLPRLIASPQFEKCNRFFAETAPWNDGLVNASALALLYYAVRITSPELIVEIGTNRGWTAQVLARAADANAHGMVHTIGPYDWERFRPRFVRWPPRLRRRLKFHPVNSAEFFQNGLAENERIGVAFIDGNHDYEFALFDIQCAACRIAPHSLIFVDDVDQIGPKCAVNDFLAKQSGWQKWSGDILERAGMAVLQAPGQVRCAAVSRDGS